MRTRTLSAAFLAALLLFGTVAGCSSDDGGDAADDNDSEQTDSNDNDSGDSGDTDELGDLGDLGDDLGDLGGDLGDCLDFSLAYAGLWTSALAAFDDSAAADLESTLGDLEGSVPDDLKEDFQTVADGIQDYVDAVEEDGITSDAAVEASDALSTGDVDEANKNIEAYITETCS